MKSIILYTIMSAIIMVSLVGCGSVKSAYVKNSDITDIATAKVGILEMKHCGPAYLKAPAEIDQTNPKVGVQIRTCTDEKRYVDYTTEMSKRLSEKLGNKTIALVPMTALDPLDYSTWSAAAAGRTAEVDYIVSGVLHQYSCPGAATATVAAAITGVTAALLPVTLSTSTQQVVTAKVEWIRTSDGKVMGEILTGKMGQGWLGSCPKLTRDIADEVYEQQFGIVAKK